MTEAELKAEARLIAIEHLLANLFAIVYRLSGATEAQIAESQQAFLEKEKWATVEGATPEQSDMLSAEFHDALERLTGLISDARTSGTAR